MAVASAPFNNEVFQAFAKYVCVLMIKMMLMSLLTGVYRMKKKAFANPEDVAGRGENAKKFLRTDPDVERVRRVHQNDLENIVPFVIVGFLYAFSGVSLSTALLHFRIFVGSRIFHTISYLIPLPQPCRGLSWFVGFLATFSMIYKLLVLVWNM